MNQTAPTGQPYIYRSPFPPIDLPDLPLPQVALRHAAALGDKLALVVQGSVEAGILSESKISQITDIPRMTIRKMLGKDATSKKGD